MPDMTPSEAAEELRHVAHLFQTPAVKQACLMGAEAIEKEIGRVLTLQECITLDNENNSCILCAETNGKEGFDWMEPKQIAALPPHIRLSYGIAWRCWTAVPSTQQKKDAVWSTKI